MNGAGFLFGGILALVAVIAVAAAIIAVAPYVAVVAVGLGFYFWFRPGQEQKKPPDGATIVKPE